MRRAGFALLFIVFATAAFLREAASQSSFTQKLAGDVFYRAADRQKKIIANAGWIVFRDYVVVIDANFPWGARDIISDLKKTTNKPIRFVFDTHYHGDHAHGNSVFVDAGATIVCSNDCMAESREKNPPAWEKSAATDPEYKAARLEHPQVGFPDRMVIDDGAHRVEFIRMGPGHTRGDAVAWLPKERILFTGDLCVNFPGNNVADKDADPDGWLRALDAMAQWDVGRVVPGHGGLGARETLLGQRAYLADMIQAVRAGIERGATADDIVRDTNLAKHNPWGQDAARNTTSLRAIYAKLKR